MRKRSKLHWSNVVCHPWAIVMYNVEPTLDQRRNAIWVYYKLDEKSLEKYITQMEKDLNIHNDIPIEEFNKIVGRAAEKTLMSKYK